MALRDQPYLPLYVQDVLTDEKLVECSASAHGVYFRLLCILHKQASYGLICLKQKYNQSKSKNKNFALMLARQMPFPEAEIEAALIELSENEVIQISSDRLSQKRMVHDGAISSMRAEQGKKGGSNITKQYGKPGYLYFMSDKENRHKIGVSVNPQSRVYRLRSDLHLSKLFGIIKAIRVDDMGKSEDLALSHFSKHRDGEWLKGDYNHLLKLFDLLEANYQANTENEIESENEDQGQPIVTPRKKRSHYNNGYMTDARARAKVAQNLIDEWPALKKYPGTNPNANREICDYLAVGMKPEIIAGVLEACFSPGNLQGWLFTEALKLGLVDEESPLRPRGYEC